MWAGATAVAARPPGITEPTLAVLVGCTSTKSSDRDGSTPDLVESGKLKTCTHLPYEPFQTRKGDSVVGFDGALVDLVAKNLKGRKLGVQQGTTGETYAKKNASGVTAVQFEDVALLL